jgi:hypothetical protein
MRTITVEPHFSDTVDMLALAVGVLANPTPNNSIRDNAAYTKHSDNCVPCYKVDNGDGGERCENGKKLLHDAQIVPNDTRGDVAQYILFNPQDYNVFRYRNPRLIHYLDAETQQRLVRRGIVGYLWGTTVVLDKKVAQGYVVVSADTRENALKSGKSLVIKISELEISPRTITISKANTDWSNGPCPVSQDHVDEGPFYEHPH